jgi:hypothetical protein
VQHKGGEGKADRQGVENLRNVIRQALACQRIHGVGQPEEQRGDEGSLPEAMRFESIEHQAAEEDFFYKADHQGDGENLCQKTKAACLQAGDKVKEHGDEGKDVINEVSPALRRAKANGFPPAHPCQDQNGDDRQTEVGETIETQI